MSDSGSFILIEFEDDGSFTVQQQNVDPVRMVGVLYTLARQYADSITEDMPIS